MEDEDRTLPTPNNFNTALFAGNPLNSQSSQQQEIQTFPLVSTFHIDSKPLPVREQSSTRIIDVRRLKKSITSRNLHQRADKKERDMSNNKIMDVGWLVASNK
jgi:hypothetical protein